MFSPNENDLPLQLYQLSNENVQCYRALPADKLKPYINYYWWMDVTPGAATLEVIPDNAIDLVMSPEIAGFALLYKPASETFTIELSGPIIYAGISLRTESAARFFNVTQTQIKNCMMGENVSESLRTEALVDGIQNLEQPEQLGMTLDRLATEWLDNQPAASPSKAKLNIDKALAAMQASVGSHGMQSIAERFELSDRQFRRIMGSLFGYGPKKVQRIMRLQSSLWKLLAADAMPLEDGFYDEAHKIKELRALTGLTPGQIKRMSEIYNSMT